MEVINIRDVQEEVSETGSPDDGKSRLKDKSPEEKLNFNQTQANQDNKQMKYVANFNPQAMKPVKQFFNKENQKKVAKYREEQDDTNTIDLNETSVYNNHNSKRIIPSPCIRYQFGVAMKDIKEPTKDSESKEDNDKSTDSLESPAQRFLAVIKAISGYIYSIDPEAKFVSWKNENDFTLLSVNPQEFPTDLVEIATYIDGYRRNIHPAIKNYFRFCLHSPKWPGKLIEQKLSTWASIQNYTLYKCIIQAETSTCIGWLA